MTTTVAVAGATGYAGSEILRLLLGHPAYRTGQLSIGALCAHSSVGSNLGEHSPHLGELADRELVDMNPGTLRGADVVFLALPHGHSAALAKQLPDDVVIIDCGADFRLKDSAAWARYYGTPHAGSWAYGLPELPGHREAIASSRTVAVPGCFPTGATLAAYPALASGIAEPTVTVVSATGVSGGGKKPATNLLGAETMGNLAPYNTAGRHRHTPEIRQNLSEVAGRDVTVSFTPVLAPLPRGIATTAVLPAAPGITADDVAAAYAHAYDNETFITVLPAGKQPHTKAVVGTNMCHVQAELDADAGVIVATSAIDNLTKGTGGAAVQCMNIVLGWDETAGLPQIGCAP